MIHFFIVKIGRRVLTEQILPIITGEHTPFLQRIKVKNSIKYKFSGMFFSYPLITEKHGIKYDCFYGVCFVHISERTGHIYENRFCKFS